MNEVTNITNTNLPSSKKERIVLSLEQIKQVIPHREPFLLIDKVEIVEKEKSAIGYKYLTGNEDFFSGHFPGNPIMPGVLVIESMAQTACVLYLSRPDLRGKFAYFMSIEETKFRKPVRPGDLLELKVEVVKAKERVGKVKGIAYVNNNVVAESEFMFVLVEAEEAKKNNKNKLAQVQQYHKLIYILLL
jgi:beta-hydroxyacyl-ACP dehydratase FabZ